MLKIENIIFREIIFPKIHPKLAIKENTIFHDDCFAYPMKSNFYS